MDLFSVAFTTPKGPDDCLFSMVVYPRIDWMEKGISISNQEAKK
jgi:hypothetical protein